MIGILVFNTVLLIFSLSQTYRLFKLLKCTDSMMLQTILFTNMVSILKEVWVPLYIAPRAEKDIEVPWYVYNIMLLYGNNFFIMAFVLTSAKW